METNISSLNSTETEKMINCQEPGVLGIVAEYNPFHNGHLYQMREAVKITGCQAVVCAMSGNFVQRGQAALIDKWERAGIAIDCGADLVIEIPVFCCLSNAGIYAKGGVSLLNSLGMVTHLAFGSESGDSGKLKEIAELLERYEVEISEKTGILSRNGMSWPAARSEAFSQITGSEYQLPSDSNDILALEYIRAVNQLESQLKIVPVKRVGPGYNDTADSDPGNIFQSATGIRKLLAEGENTGKFVPPASEKKFFQITPEELRQRENRYFDILRYKILMSDEAVFAKLPDGGEGIGNRLKKAVRSAESIEELIGLTKSRRYTYTHVSRLLMELLVETDREMKDPAYIRVLAMNSRGRKLLKDSVKNGRNTLPVITNVNKTLRRLDESDENDRKIRDQLMTEVRGTDVYNLITGKELYKNSDRVRSLVPAR